MNLEQLKECLEGIKAGDSIVLKCKSGYVVGILRYVDILSEQISVNIIDSGETFISFKNVFDITKLELAEKEYRTAISVGFFQPMASTIAEVVEHHINKLRIDFLGRTIEYKQRGCKYTHGKLINIELDDINIIKNENGKQVSPKLKFEFDNSLDLVYSCDIESFRIKKENFKEGDKNDEQHRL